MLAPNGQLSGIAKWCIQDIWLLGFSILGSIAVLWDEGLWIGEVFSGFALSIPAEPIVEIRNVINLVFVWVRVDACVAKDVVVILDSRRATMVMTKPIWGRMTFRITRIMKGRGTFNLASKIFWGFEWIARYNPKAVLENIEPRWQKLYTLLKRRTLCWNLRYKPTHNTPPVQLLALASQLSSIIT